MILFELLLQLCQKVHQVVVREQERVEVLLEPAVRAELLAA